MTVEIEWSHDEDKEEDRWYGYFDDVRIEHEEEYEVPTEFRWLDGELVARYIDLDNYPRHAADEEVIVGRFGTLEEANQAAVEYLRACLDKPKEAVK